MKIGQVRRNGETLELWDLQSGAMPGSEHTLLLRKPEEGLIARFEVLQRDCPLRFERTGPPIDIWRTSYCAINSRAELLGFARAMATKPVLGALEYLPSPATNQAAAGEGN